MPHKRELLENWYHKVWVEEDASAINAMFAKGGAVHRYGERDIIGPEEFRWFHAEMCRFLSDISITMDLVISDGDWLSAICTLNATSRETGAAVSTSGSVMARISDGMLQEGYDHWDFMTLWCQLGHLPSDCFAQGLNGKKVCWQETGKAHSL